MSENSSIQMLEKKLKIHPNDVNSRLKLMDLLFASGDFHHELPRENILWFINYRPEIVAPWNEWKVFFLEGGGELRPLWEKQISRNPKNVAVLINAGEMLLLIDSPFAIECRKKASELRPYDKNLQESLAFSIFLQNPASYEAFEIFKNLFNNRVTFADVVDLICKIVTLSYDKRWRRSVFMLAIAAINAFEAKQDAEFDNYVSKLERDMPQTLNERFDLYPAYSVLVLAAIKKKNTELVLSRINDLIKVSSFGYSSLIMYDGRVIKKLYETKLTEQAKILADAYLAKDNSTEMKDALKDFL